ncbi:hypothetical protein [Crateriforma conspicua]|uniref:Uncharacterized protein n=2 Tax=Crateriforma conspicua TaxID=2527996 RepID=A0A5C5YFF7_9PLAN|nr:hypothetical protein [Crateriforma conspicua]TWT72002.1 hypothetical protein Pan14r_43190 [Crateriforma conspicua]
MKRNEKAFALRCWEMVQAAAVAGRRQGLQLATGKCGNSSAFWQGQASPVHRIARDVPGSDSPAEIRGGIALSVVMFFLGG